MAKDEAAIHELILYSENERDLYNKEKSIQQNLARKMVKGTYDKALAPKIWLYLAKAASDKYKKEFGEAFTVQTRKDAAEEMARAFEREVKNHSVEMLYEVAGLKKPAAKKTTHKKK